MKPINSYDDAFTALMGNEGGYSNNPADPGGETMWGITVRVARANGYAGPMINLPQSTAKAIAKSQYWDKIHGDDFSPAVSFQLFDAIYNGGKPAQWVQQAAGVTADGVIGPTTIAAVNASDPDKIIMRFDAYRLQYLASLPTRATFAGGWMNRIANNLLIGAA
jgi:lysozyme family protein